MSRSVRELHEEVYDSGGTHLDEKCSLIDEDYWYENDLVLAAELGKTLLERNKELEKQLVQSQRENSDHLVEIDLLTKQLSTLRELSHSKMRIYEEVDKQCTELERSNKAVLAENKADKQRIQSLTDHIVALEARQEDLREQLERSKRSADSKSVVSRPERRVRKARSVPNVAEQTPGTLRRYHQPAKTAEERQTNADIDEVIRLHDKLCELSFQVTSERRKRESLESEARLQLLENEDLRGVISSLRSELLAVRTAAEQVEASALCEHCSSPRQNGLSVSSEEELEEEVKIEKEESLQSPKISPRPRKQDAVAKDLFSAVEHDAVSVREGEIGRLKSGGKVFSSRESLNRVGAEATATAEKSGDISLLAELDTQYNKLVRQYEDLIATKQPDGGGDVTSGGTAAATGAAMGSSVEATTTSAHFEQKLNAIFSEETRRQRKTMITPNYRPQYKQLFREAFSVLKDMKNKGQEGQ